MTQPITLYRNPKSGHCHRVELLLSLLGLPYETIDLDMANGAHKAPDYLKISPFGKVPAIRDGDYTLSDSNAILVYLTNTYASQSDWMPSAPRELAEIQRWLTVAADQLFSGACAARLVKVFNASLHHGSAVSNAHALLNIMDVHLSDREWLATDTISIADIALYSYTAHAPEGGVDLAPYAHVRTWLNRIEALPGFVAMPSSPIPELA